jgi:hypothetical protein
VVASCPPALPPVSRADPAREDSPRGGDGVPYEALTQCWYTREHRPTALRFHEDDGSTFSICRHCGRRIVTWGKHSWSIADGLNVTRLAEMVVGRVLTVLDKADDLVVRRFTVGHLPDEAAIEEFKAELRARYAMDEPGSDLTLIDSAKQKPVRRARKSSQPPAFPAPDIPRTA